MKTIAEALAEMLDLPQFHPHRDPRMTQTTDPNIADRAIMIFHLERALRLLRNHEGSREECERTKGLIASTEARIRELRSGAPLGWPIPPLPPIDEVQP